MGTADCRKQGLPMVLYEHQYPRLARYQLVLWEEELQRSWWEGTQIWRARRPMTSSAVRLGAEAEAVDKL